MDNGLANLGDAMGIVSSGFLHRMEVQGRFGYEPEDSEEIVKITGIFPFS